MSSSFKSCGIVIFADTFRISLNSPEFSTLKDRFLIVGDVLYNTFIRVLFKFLYFDCSRLELNSVSASGGEVFQIAVVICSFRTDKV